MVFFKILILRYVCFKLTLMQFAEFIEEVKKETKRISVKHKRERKHNFIEVENEITYGESIVKKSRA